MGRREIVYHDFYCLSCGRKSYTLPRKKGRRHAKFHRKVLYCPHCHAVINHVECRDESEAKEFLEKMDAGFFDAEACESLERGRRSVT